MPFLLFFIYLLFPFGELLRFDLGNSIIFKPIDVLVVVTAMFWIIKQVLQQNIPKERLVKPIGLFLFISILSLLVNTYWLTGTQVFVAFLYWLRFTSYIIIFFIVSKLTQSKKNVLLLIMLLCGFFVALFGFIQYILYTNLVNLSYLGWDEHWFRLFSTFFDPNFVGIFMVLYFLLTFHYTVISFTKKPVFPKILFGIFSCISLVAIFLTFSRAALLSLLTGIIVYVILQKKNRLIPLFALGAFLLGIGIILLNYKATEGTKLFRLASSVARVTSVQNAITIISKSPFFGVGFDAYRYAQLRFHIAEGPNWQQSHSGAGTDNSFLFVFATTGVIGFLSFTYFLKKIFDEALRIFPKNPFSLVVISSFCAVIVNSFFLNSLFYPFILLWLVSILGIIEKDER